MAELAIAWLGSTVGSAIGAQVGMAALGAQVGWAVGSYLASDRDEITQKGPRLREFKVGVTAKGQGIPIVYGTYRVPAQIIWLGEVKETVNQFDLGKGGKGGGSSQAEFIYTATFAVGICEGPITSIRRIWADGQLYYDASPDASIESLVVSGSLITGYKASSGFDTYLGTEDQLPHPTMESFEGAGNVPAYRGISYMVLDNIPLEDFGNRIPRIEIEIVVDGPPLSSRFLYVESIPAPLNATFGAVFKDRTPSILATVAARLFIGGVWLAGRRDYYAGFSLPQKAVATGKFMYVPNRTLGDVEFVIIGYAGLIVYFENTGVPKVFPNSEYSTSSGNFQCVYDAESERIFTTWSSYRGGTLTANAIGGGTVVRNDEYFLSMVLANGVLYAITYTKLFQLDPATLSTISSVSHSSYYSLLSSGTYISYWDGLIWVMPSNGLGGQDALTSALQAFDPDTGDRVVLIRDIPYSGASTSGVYATVSNGMLVYANVATDTVGAVQFDVVSSGGQSSSTVVSNVCERAGLTALDYDVSSLTDNVRGYIIDRPMAARKMIEPLQRAFWFDAAETNGRIVFTKRGTSSPITIPDADLRAKVLTAGKDKNVVELDSARIASMELPHEIRVKYSDSDKYDPTIQYARRLITQFKGR